MRKYLLYVLVIAALAGVFDAAFLTREHYLGVTPPCSESAWVDCGQVLRSEYAVLFGVVPMALLGLVYYGLLLIYSLGVYLTGKRVFKYLLLVFTAGGLLFTFYLLYIQAFLIGKACLYCIASAVISVIVFVIAQYLYPFERKQSWVTFQGFVYRKIMRRFIFLIDSERIHVMMLGLGEILGKIGVARVELAYLHKMELPELTQEIAGMEFKTPVGLAAGFDYEAKLTQILEPVGVGFQSVGSITNKPYEGNAPPRLGRLPKSRSLMVNKGFKNPGVVAIIKKLRGMSFPAPVGISVGRTNLRSMNTLNKAIEDLVKSFSLLEKSVLVH